MVGSIPGPGYTPIFLDPGESPWKEKPSRLQSIGSNRVRHNCSTLACTYMHSLLLPLSSPNRESWIAKHLLYVAWKSTEGHLFIYFIFNVFNFFLWEMETYKNKQKSFITKLQQKIILADGFLLTFGIKRQRGLKQLNYIAPILLTVYSHPYFCDMISECLYLDVLSPFKGLISNCLFHADQFLLPDFILVELC